jgi:D-3-phosphoglycerate dehydrogenase
MPTQSTALSNDPKANAADKAPEDVSARRGSFGGSNKVKVLKPFNTANMKILLLENVNETAVSALRDQGYQVRFLLKDLDLHEMEERERDQLR